MFFLEGQEATRTILSLEFSVKEKKDRPNTLGLCTVELLEHHNRTIKVKFLDAIDGTPILDIKPLFKEFQPKGKIKQPGWVTDLMKNYWKNSYKPRPVTFFSGRGRDS